MNGAFLFSVLHFRLPAAILNFAHAQMFDRGVRKAWLRRLRYWNAGSGGEIEATRYIFAGDLMYNLISIDMNSVQS